ncbi:nickel/cobalt transporter, partial [Treponema pallidum]
MKKVGVRVRACILCALAACATGVLANPFFGGAPARPRRQRTPELLLRRYALVHQRLGAAIVQWSKTHSTRAWWITVMLSFAYGVLHALGPGHRKAALFSFYLGRNAPVWEPALTAALLAALHGAASLLLLSAFRGVSGAIGAHSARTMWYMEVGSYGLLTFLALFSLVHELMHLFPSGGRYFSCGCSAHTAVCMRTGTVAHMQWGTMLLSGLFICPAALFVMILVLSLDAVGLGVAAVLSISAGLALPLMAVGYLAWASRAGIFY